MALISHSRLDFRALALSTDIFLNVLVLKLLFQSIGKSILPCSEWASFPKPSGPFTLSLFRFQVIDHMGFEPEPAGCHPRSPRNVNAGRATAGGLRQISTGPVADQNEASLK